MITDTKQHTRSGGGGGVFFTNAHAMTFLSDQRKVFKFKGYFFSLIFYSLVHS